MHGKCHTYRSGNKNLYTESKNRFGADLVLGLPETDESYNGIPVITEYLTKFTHGF
jgi:hypothetical protein